MDNRKKKCPKCGKMVIALTFEGKGKKPVYYYENIPLTNMEKKLQKTLGMPFGHLVPHKCKTDKAKGTS